MKNALLLLAIVITAPNFAQNYTRDAGVRIGTLPSFTYRQYNREIQAFEVMASVSWRSLRLSFLKENVKPAFMQVSDNIEFVYGFGGHVGFDYTNKYRFLFRTYNIGEWKLSPLIGLDAYFSFEYRFREFPFTIGIDYKPFFEFSTTRIFYIFLDDTSLSLKYKF